MSWTRYEAIAFLAFLAFSLLTAGVSLALALLYGIGTVSTECAC